MGNMCAKNTLPTKKNLKDRVVRSIDLEDIDALSMLLATHGTTSPQSAECLRVDEPVTCKHAVTYNQIPMSALTYALVIGKLKCFRYLMEEAGASLIVTQKQLNYLRKRPLDVLLDACNVQFLDYYLPIHLRQSQASIYSNSQIEELSFLSLAKSKGKPKLLATLPSSIHRVVEKGNLDALKYLLDYFKNSLAPSELDVHCVDDASGENCALLAVRSGNLDMLEFLHEDCKADFLILNKRRESAIQIAAAASKKNPRIPLQEVISFLVEEVGVDLAYNCEETLMLCENAAIVTYLETKLSSLGVNVKKAQIELVHKDCLLVSHIDSAQVAQMRYFKETSVSKLLREEHCKQDSLSSIMKESQESSFTQDWTF
jgi:hypothetical protein